MAASARASDISAHAPRGIGSRQRIVRPGAPAKRARRKFLTFYPGGFQDPDYVDLERDYKWQAHLRWRRQLKESQLRRLIKTGEFATVAARAVAIESRTNLLFSFEKMALRDGVRSARGAESFARGLLNLLHGADPMGERFDAWCDTIASLPRRQTRVLTWPVATVFGFIAQPGTHIYFKPMVTKAAARAYGYPFEYETRPSWDAYRRLLAFARAVKSDVADMRPRDMIDIQSFIWVQGSEEYSG